MKHVILGTAGHIDHGKTSLIKALSGIDTDRLKEEKERGITIELGFAHLTLPSGQKLGIVDVPGHERFVRHMVAGASGIDIVALIIAADEGVMPQTREHLEICQLLNVKSGLVVLTKKDMVDEEWLELVRDDVSKFLKGTFLEEAPIVAVSSLTGDGLSELTGALESLAAGVIEKPAGGPFRLPIDRVFTIKGFGTVVTGASISGKISTGDSVTIYPRELPAKIRGLQVHNQEVREVKAGLRTAINLQGIEKETVERGDVLATANSLGNSYLLDVSLYYLPSISRPLKNSSPVRFHTGTCEIAARVTLLDRDELKPGEKTYAQLRLLKKAAVLPGDRYVLRSYSPTRTIGGGEILHPVPKRHKRFIEATLSDLKTLEAGSPEEIVLLHVNKAGAQGLMRRQLALLGGLNEQALASTIYKLTKSGDILLFNQENQAFVASGVYEKAGGNVLGILQDYHKRNPLLFGIPKEELRSKLSSGMDPRLFSFLINDLVQSKRLVPEKELLRLPGHKVDLQVDEKGLKDRIEKIYLEAGWEPPSRSAVSELLGKDGAQAGKFIDLLIRENILVKVKEDLCFHHRPLAELKDRIVDFLRKHQEITPGQFKEVTNLSRKYMIPLLEYFDTVKITIRVGDKRVLREKK
jgi:selenocysteine-specific elongation factor